MLGWGGEEACGAEGKLPRFVVRVAPNVGMVMTGKVRFSVACAAGWIM